MNLEVEKSYHFQAYLARMKYITRWGLMRNTYPENIQEHSLQVSVIAHCLAIIRNKLFDGNINPERIAVLAMYHDCNEIITGDLPTPIKYFNPQIKQAYKDVEEISKNKLLSMLPLEIEEEYKKIFFCEELNEAGVELVKAADRISAYIKCLEEVKASNGEFKKARDSIKETIDSINLPEVNYFIKHFIPSFTLTLDELE